MAGRRREGYLEPEEELGITHECRDWRHCALCRSTRLGTETLERARQRQVEWRESNTPLCDNPVKEPVPFTTLDDAFDSLFHLMSTTSRKCHNYHCCHEHHSPSGSQAHRHRQRYHNHHRYGDTYHTHQLTLTPPPRVVVNTLPGNYTVTAARWDPQATPTTRVVTLDPEKCITMTMTV